METLGYAKRDLLVERIQNTRDAQIDAKREFRTTADYLARVASTSNDQLEGEYYELKRQIRRSEQRARRMSDGIDSVDAVAQALFDDWKAETGQYKSSRLKEAAAAKKVAMERQYSQLARSMQRAESATTPVLLSFRDQLLFLENNLNSRAVISIKEELPDLQRDLDSMVAEVDRSINQATDFMSALKEVGKKIS